MEKGIDKKFRCLGLAISLYKRAFLSLQQEVALTHFVEEIKAYRGAMTCLKSQSK